MANDINGSIVTKFPVHRIGFRDEEDVFDGASLGEVTEVADGYVELGLDYGDDRVYVRFRKSDLDRAVKEIAHDHD